MDKNVPVAATMSEEDNYKFVYHRQSSKSEQDSENKSTTSNHENSCGCQSKRGDLALRMLHIICQMI